MGRNAIKTLLNILNFNNLHFVLAPRKDNSSFWDEHQIETVLKRLISNYTDDQLVDAIEDGNCSEIIDIVNRTAPSLGPAMLWASWKGGDNISEVLSALINLGGKANQVRVFKHEAHGRTLSAHKYI